jgi:ribosomal protein S17E
VQAEGCFELYKKKKVSQKQAKRYQQMLENDYPGNKIIVTAYQSGLLKCVQNVNREKKKQ